MFFNKGPSLYHETIEDNELNKEQVYMCGLKQTEKNYYFIYALWYRETWKPHEIIINCNWVWWEIKTLQANEHTTHDNKTPLKFIDDSKFLSFTGQAPRRYYFCYSYSSSSVNSCACKYQKIHTITAVPYFCIVWIFWYLQAHEFTEDEE